MLDVSTASCVKNIETGSCNQFSHRQLHISDRRDYGCWKF